MLEMVIDLVWGFIIVSVFIIGLLVLGYSVIIFISKWISYFEAQSDKFWVGYKDNDEIPPDENLRASYIYLCIAHPYKIWWKTPRFDEHKESMTDEKS